MVLLKVILLILCWSYNASLWGPFASSRPSLTPPLSYR